MQKIYGTDRLYEAWSGTVNDRCVMKPDLTSSNTLPLTSTTSAAAGRTPSSPVTDEFSTVFVSCSSGPRSLSTALRTDQEHLN